MRRTTGCAGLVLAPTRMCEKAMALLLDRAGSNRWGRAPAGGAARRLGICWERSSSQQHFAFFVTLSAWPSCHRVSGDARNNVAIEASHSGVPLSLCGATVVLRCEQEQNSTKTSKKKGLPCGNPFIIIRDGVSGGANARGNAGGRASRRR